MQLVCNKNITKIAWYVKKTKLLYKSLGFLFLGSPIILYIHGYYNTNAKFNQSPIWDILSK